MSWDLLGRGRFGWCHSQGRRGGGLRPFKNLLPFWGKDSRLPPLTPGWAIFLLSSYPGSLVCTHSWALGFRKVLSSLIPESEFLRLLDSLPNLWPGLNLYLNRSWMRCWRADFLYKIIVWMKLSPWFLSSIFDIVIICTSHLKTQLLEGFLFALNCVSVCTGCIPSAPCSGQTQSHYHLSFQRQRFLLGLPIEFLVPPMWCLLSLVHDGVWLVLSAHSSLLSSCFWMTPPLGKLPKIVIFHTSIIVFLQ